MTLLGCENKSLIKIEPYQRPESNPEPWYKEASVLPLDFYYLPTDAFLTRIVKLF